MNIINKSIKNSTLIIKDFEEHFISMWFDEKENIGPVFIGIKKEKNREILLTA